ncbi:MAG: peptidoglycan DD-metalloendopeptidase family protein [Minisyncoccia bacterium]
MKKALFILILAVPWVLGAEEAEQIRAQISTQQNQLELINKEIQQYEKQLVEVSGKKQTLQSAVNELDVSLKKTTMQVKATQNKISTTELEIQELDSDIYTKEQLIALDSQAISEMMRRLNTIDEASFMEHLLSRDSFAGVWDETESLATLQETMRIHVDSLLNAKEALTQDLNQAEEKHETLVGQKKNLAAEEQSIAVTKREQAGLLSQTKSQESNYQKILADKKAAKDQFEKALDDLESRLQYTLDPSNFAAAGKGILRWPLDSVTVTQQFGRTSDSGRLYASGSHNGTDFRAAVGTPVKAALSGTIVGTGNSDEIRGCYSYGKWIMVKHNNGLSTLYAHLSQISVSRGEQVATSDVIGYSGNTGYSTGPHLHFGLYVTEAVQIRQLGTNTPCGRATIPVSPQTGYLNPLEYL